MSEYVAFPLTIRKQLLRPTEAIARKAERILGEFLNHENFFTAYLSACEDRCGRCSDCLAVKQNVAAALIDRKSLVWEVWKLDESGDLVDIVGILRLSRIDPGCDALAHYFFFDGRLSDKTDLLLWWRDWAFSDHDDWIGLNRVTIEVPSYAFTLASHAIRKLGFGGPYEYSAGGRSWPVEGVRSDAKKKGDRWFDMMILGLKRADLGEDN